MAQQTAVEWLVEKLKKNDIAYGMFDLYNHDEIFEQAKQMEKEQKIKLAQQYAERCQAPITQSKWLEKNN